MNDNKPLPPTPDVVYLDEAQWDRFIHEMLNPRPPTKAMREAWALWDKFQAQRGNCATSTDRECPQAFLTT